MFLFPKTIEKRNSKVSGTIEVVKHFGRLSITAGGYTQSGGLVHTIWEHVLRQIAAEGKNDPTRCLILGLGAGSAAMVTSQLWPNAEIVGIEIDPVMISLGKKYFSLKRLFNLTIVNVDAVAWVIEQTTRPVSIGYDLMLVDLYIGGSPPEGSLQHRFLRGIRRLLTDDGQAIYNLLITSRKPVKVWEFRKLLNTEFERVKRLPSPANALFSVHK